MKNLGYITARPSEFIIQQRFGKIRRHGRGIGFLCLPFIDRYYRIPSTTHGLAFAADQITAENQGVEVSGFAIWKIGDPLKASTNFDFADAPAAVQGISTNLKDVVESAIRHQVAKMTMEDVLRKRGSIILQLKQELAYIADQWGLIIETIEIKNVRIMSDQLFANMQAKYRDEVRLVSETSSLETEREIAQRRFAQREQLALKEQEFKLRESQRKAELDANSARAAAELEVQRLAQQKERQALTLAHDVELAVLQHEKREKELRLEEQLCAVEGEVQARRFEVEAGRQQHESAMAASRDETQRRHIETANLASPALALIEQLPGALGSLQAHEINLGDDLLTRLGAAATSIVKREAK